MIQDMLERYGREVAEPLRDRIQTARELRDEVRRRLEDRDLLKSVGDVVSSSDEIPTCAGVDGTYLVERTLSADIVAVAAVAVEGLVPPRETRFWPQPHHEFWIAPVEHADRTPTGAKGLMLGMEVSLAAGAPHRVVMLDGSLTTHLIAFGQAMRAVGGSGGRPLLPERLAEALRERMEGILRDFLTVLRSERVDRNYVGVPKYSSRTEVSDELGLRELGLAMNDKALMSLVLRPDEFVGPLPLTRPEDRWHLTLGEYFGGRDSPVRETFEGLREEILSALSQIQVIYVRVSPANPALRMELPRAVAENRARLARVLLAARYQAGVMGVIEPYPLYLADLMVKQIWAAVGNLKDAALSQMTDEENIGDILMSLREYRTEGGF